MSLEQNLYGALTVNQTGRQANLFEILSSHGREAFDMTNPLWAPLSARDDGNLFERIIAEVGDSATISQALSYILSTESDHAKALSDTVKLNSRNKLAGETTKAILDKFGYSLRSLPKMQSQHREKEAMLVRIALHRDYKSNVLLVGAPGVGKTHLVRMVSETVPRDIFCVDTSKILAGSRYRGDFEEKMQQIIAYAITTNTILFFDEAHTILATGTSDGGISGSDILKPYLLDGQLTIIGATTDREYEFLRNDAAFDRRFTVIHLREFSVSDSCDVVLERFPVARALDRSTLEAILAEVDRQQPKRSNPDKAIDFFDFFSAACRLSVIHPSDPYAALNLFKNAPDENRVTIE